MKTIDRDTLPCKYYAEWWEDVVGDGGPRMQMSDCTCETPLTAEQLTAFEKNGEKCDRTCPTYTPVDVYTCVRHNQEYYDYCPKCEEEACRQVDEAEDKMNDLKNMLEKEGPIIRESEV